MPDEVGTLLLPHGVHAAVLPAGAVENAGHGTQVRFWMYCPTPHWIGGHRPVARLGWPSGPHTAHAVDLAGASWPAGHGVQVVALLLYVLTGQLTQDRLATIWPAVQASGAHVPCAVATLSSSQGVHVADPGTATALAGHGAQSVRLAGTELVAHGRHWPPTRTVLTLEQLTQAEAEVEPGGDPWPAPQGRHVAASGPR